MPYVPRPERPASDPSAFGAYIAHYLEHLRARAYNAQGIAYRRMGLHQFVAWLEARGITRISEVTRPILDRYAKHLHYALNRSGRPLSVSTQTNRLIAIRHFFRYLVRQNHLLYNPAAELELPRGEHRLPQAVMTVEEAERVLTQPDITAPEGILQRTVMEVLYSTGIRRAELVNLDLADVNAGRGVLSVRQGKGKKDRFVPIGDRALLWVQKYLDEVRRSWEMPASPKALFLDPLGQRLDPHRISRAVQKHIDAAQIGKQGRCHIFRHTMATLMLEGGADIRYIQHILGHAQLSTTEIYTHVAIGKLKDVHTLTHPAKLPAEVQARLVLARQAYETHRLSAPSAQDVLSALAAEADEDEREGDD